MTDMHISITQQFNVRVLLGSDTQNEILKDWCESTCKKKVVWWASTGYGRKFHWSANYKMQSLKKEIIPCLYVLTEEKRQYKNFLPFCSWGSQRWEFRMELQPHVACILCKFVHFRWYRRHCIHYVHSAGMHMHI